MGMLPIVWTSPDEDRIKVSWDVASTMVELGEGVFMYADTRVRIVGWTHDVEIKVDVVDGRLSAVDVRISYRTGVHGATPVTGAVIREVPIANLVKHASVAVQHVRSEAHDGARQVGALWPDTDEIAYVAEHGQTNRTLSIVARVYRAAYLIGDPPTKAVETTLKVPRSTAGRWVAVAREQGYLGPADGPGRAGGVTAND